MGGYHYLDLDETRLLSSRLSHAARTDAAPSQTVAPQPRSVCGASIFSCSDVPARSEIVHRRQLSTIWHERESQVLLDRCS